MAESMLLWAALSLYALSMALAVPAGPVFDSVRRFG